MIDQNQKKRQYGLSTFVGNARKNGIVSALGTDIVETAKLYKPTCFSKDYPTYDNPRQIVSDAVCITGTLVALCGFVGTVLASPVIISNKLEARTREGQTTALWEEYSGEIPYYKVNISESHSKNGSNERDVLLNASDKKVVPYEIHGIDYNMDGRFDEIFIEDKKYDPCDSVILDNGKVVWDPSPASVESKKAPFTETQILDAQRKLHYALTTVRKDGNKYRHWTTGMKDGGIISKFK